MSDFDVVIVGARCAGSPLAAMLARSGISVCVLDKDAFPSETISTHGVQPAGVKVLGRLGVLGELEKVSPPLRSGRLVFDDCIAHIPDIEAITGAYLISARRGVLDAILADAAREAGAEVRTKVRVTGLVRDGSRVAGVETPEGEIRARLVVGADGVRSAVAKLAGAREYCPTKNGRIFMWGYYEGEPSNGEAWIGQLGDYAYLVTPCDHGLCLVAACPSLDRRDEVRRDREGVHAEGVRAWPELYDGLAGKRREGPIHTMANMQGFFRESAGPGWVLVGDAGHFKDPTPGQGIADALRQAERLAGDIERALGAESEAVADAVLAEWWRWRDDDAWEMYWFAHDMGAGGPVPPLLAEINRRVASDPELTKAAIRVLNHDVRPSEVFTPAFGLRAAAGALRTRRGERRAILREAAEVARDRLRRDRARKRIPSAVSSV